MQPQLASLTVISAVNEDSSAGRLKETTGQIHQRTFSCAGLSNYRHVCASRNLQIKIAEHFFFSIRILEGNVFKLDVTFDRFPVFFVRMKEVPILFQNFRGIYHLGLLFQKIGHSLNICLGGNTL